MAQLLTEGFTQNTVAVTLVTTAETVIISSPTIEIPEGANFVLLLATCGLTLGAGTTSLTARFRRGTAVTGTQIFTSGALTGGIAAAGLISPTFMAVDSAPLGDLYQASLTLTQGAATANGTTSVQSIAVFIF